MGPTAAVSQSPLASRSDFTCCLADWAGMESSLDVFITTGVFVKELPAKELPGGLGSDPVMGTLFGSFW